MPTITEAQLKALDLLQHAYDADRSVVVGPKTRRSPDGSFGISRVIAQRLVNLGLARYSHPAGKFLLITDTGRRFQAAA